MEVIGESPPPLPPKTKQKLSLPLKDSNVTNFSSFCKSLVLPSNGFEATTSPGATKAGDNQSDKQTSAQATWSVVTPEPMSEQMSRWSIVGNDKSNSTEERLYENVVNGVYDVVRRGDSSAQEGKTAERRRKTPKIEVRQEDHKTVVKISIKDTPSPEEVKKVFGKRQEMVHVNVEGDRTNGGADGNVNPDESNEVIYENLNMAEGRQYYENVIPNRCGKTVSDECIYVNLNTGPRSRDKRKELLATAVDYCNADCDLTQTNTNHHHRDDKVVYENENFEFVKCQKFTSSSSSSGTIRVPEWTDRTSIERIDDDAYENVVEPSGDGSPVYENENLFLNGIKNVQRIKELEMENDVDEPEREKPKKLYVGLTLQNGTTKEDGNSCRDPFDSGTSSDVESLPAFVQTKKGNVIVTIKSLQSCADTELKRDPIGHRRAESLTSSGVGVDSEESEGDENDDEKSNISCDSLNSSGEPYPQSNSEDHGYHTPNSEDKTGSPVDASLSAFENILIKEEKEIKSPATDATNVKERRQAFLEQVLEPSDFEEYENVHVFEKKPFYVKKKKPPPPPPPKHGQFWPPPTTKQGQEDEEEEEDYGDGGEEKEGKDDQKLLPKNLLRDIRSRNVRLSSTYPNGESKREIKTSVAEIVLNLESSQGECPTPRKSAKESEEKEVKEGGGGREGEGEGEEEDKQVKGERKTKAPTLKTHKRGLEVEERTYEDRNLNVKSVKMNVICAMDVDTDQFYKFHLSEKNIRDDKGGSEEETFAGIKDYLSREKASAITSAKGTIRGVKNRVKAGIATFLQMHENKSYKDKDAGKVVVYTTTMGIVRETYHKCLKVKQILRTLMVKFEERDVFMSSDVQEEIRERMKCDVILVPQVFVEGQHIGDAETIERLNEMGELRTILKQYKSPESCSTCKVCGGYRLLPCRVCKGSKKSIHRNHFTAEFVSLKCMNCDQVGLTRCHAC